MLHKAKHNAKHNGVPFTITRADVSLPTHCPVLGIALKLFGAPLDPALPSLDKVYPDLGYIPGNVRVISLKANMIKGTCIDANELRAVADYMDFSQRLVFG